ncbi:unnamed protein product [Rhizopus stolonifer]
MMGSVMGPLFDPEFEAMLFTALLFISMMLILLIIFIAFLTVRIDQIVEWPWRVVWIPAWIMNIITFYRLIRLIISNKQEDEKLDEEEKKSNESKSKKRMTQITWILYYLLFLLFQIFIVLRLDNQIDWTVCKVFVPYFIFEGVRCLSISLITFSVISSFEKRHWPYYIFEQYWFIALRFCTFLLIALRIDHIIQCSWAIVFIPLYLVGLKLAVELVYRYYTYSVLPQPEMAHQGKITVIFGMILFVIVGILAYALIGLIANRLDGYVFVRMSNVFVPLFIVFSFSLCCSGCCLPCLLKLSTTSDPEEFETLHPIVSSKKRITVS